MSRMHRLPLFATLGLGIVFGVLADRLLDVSPPTAEAQTRISLADLQAQIATLQTGVAALEAGIQAIPASNITGVLTLNRLPPDVVTQAQVAAQFVPLSGGTMTGPLACPSLISFGGVQVGFDGNAAVNPGTMRFNGATNTIEFSDGTSWRRLQVAP